jgi:group I intron endonuclease
MIIYITKNLINGKKYIGKDSHNNPNYLGSGALFLEDIKKYGKENFKKEILEYCNKETLGEREEYWINYFNAVESKDFYNIRSKTSGWFNKDLNLEKYKYVVNKISKGNQGKIVTQETKDKISNNQERKNKLKVANLGKSKPEGFGEKISKIKKDQNISMSDEIKTKISQAKKGHACFQTQSFKEKHSKAIIQLDKDNNIIAEFKSIDEAAKSNIKFKRSNISCCLTGRVKRAYGYLWKYV